MGGSQCKPCEDCPPIDVEKCCECPTQETWICNTDSIQETHNLLVSQEYDRYDTEKGKRDKMILDIKAEVDTLTDTKQNNEDTISELRATLKANEDVDNQSGLSQCKKENEDKVQEYNNCITKTIPDAIDARNRSCSKLRDAKKTAIDIMPDWHPCKCKIQFKSALSEEHGKPNTICRPGESDCGSCPPPEGISSYFIQWGGMSWSMQTNPSDAEESRTFGSLHANFSVLPTCVKDGKVLSTRDDDFNIVYDVSGVKKDCLCSGNALLDGQKNEGCKRDEGSTCVVSADQAWSTAQPICTSQLGGTWIQPVDRVGTSERPFTSCEDFQNNPIDQIVWYNSDKWTLASKNDVSLGDVYHMLGITSKRSDLTDACNVGYKYGDRGDCNIYTGEDPAGTTKPYYGNALARACLIGTDLKNNVNRKGWFLKKVGDKHICKEWKKCSPGDQFDPYQGGDSQPNGIQSTTPPQRGQYQAQAPTETTDRVCKNFTCKGDNCKWPETSAYYPRGEGSRYRQTDGGVPDCMRGRWTCGRYAISDNI